MKCIVGAFVVDPSGSKNGITVKVRLFYSDRNLRVRQTYRRFWRKSRKNGTGTGRA